MSPSPSSRLTALDIHVSRYSGKILREPRQRYRAHRPLPFERLDPEFVAHPCAQHLGQFR